MSQAPVNIICMRWGTRYSPDYVHRLHAGIKRHLKRPFRFICLTDQPEVLNSEIETHPFPPNPGVVGPTWPNVFLKLEMTKDGFIGLEGPTLFLDVDILIMDSMDEFFTYKEGKNCIIHNWIERRKELFRGRPDIGNSSIFRFEAGKSQYIHDTFMREIDKVTDRDLYPTEQAFLTYAMKEKYWWPEEWVKSFKRSCRPIFPLNLIKPPSPPPAGTKVLVFHGRPDPTDAVTGYQGKRIHHRLLPAPWVADHWRE